MNCPLFQKCIFFNDNMVNMPNTAEQLKVAFCKDDYENCAIYQVKQATGVAHETLWPNEIGKVEEIIRSIKKPS
jgi:hypothetical protein